MVEDLRQAEYVILRSVQNHHFQEEISALQALEGGEFQDGRSARARNQKLKQASSLFKLDPFLSQDGLLRVGGRIKRAEISLEEKHPVILPKKSHVTTLVIRHHHQDVQHQGRLMTLNEIRQRGYWVIDGRGTVSDLIAKCVTCRRLRSPTECQKMSDLPVDRLTEAPPFSYAGVDAFGPWYIKEGRKTLKRYGLVFTCMASRAIHLETLNSMETDSFICALRRFINRRGSVRQLRSDRRKNFIGAKRELADAWMEMDQSKIQDFLLTKSCDWLEFRMNVPYASHMGGVWERQIRSVRSVMTALLEDLGTQLDDESLRTLFTEAENIVNSRPPTADLRSPDSPEPITPIQLLTLKSKVVLPPPGNFTQPDVCSRKRWRRVQFLANRFWDRWRREYLQTLQARPKWQSPQRNFEVGDVVIVKEDNVPRNEWTLGKVTKLYPSVDDRIRKVQVLVASSDVERKVRRQEERKVLDRPIHKLVLLVESPTERSQTRETVHTDRPQ